MQITFDESVSSSVGEITWGTTLTKLIIGNQIPHGRLTDTNT